MRGSANEPQVLIFGLKFSYVLVFTCLVKCAQCIVNCALGSVEGRILRVSAIEPQVLLLTSLPHLPCPLPVACLPAYSARQNLAHVIPTLNIVDWVAECSMALLPNYTTSLPHLPCPSCCLPTYLPIVPCHTNPSNQSIGSIITPSLPSVACLPILPGNTQLLPCSCPTNP